MDMLFRTAPFWPLIVLRLGLAAVFFAHSAQQLGWLGGASSARQVVRAWKDRYAIPTPIGAVGIFTEFFGSWAMLLGFLTRPFALGLMIFMFVAMWKAHWKHGFFLAHRGGEGNGIEFCLMLFLMALALVIGGGGPLSLDLKLGE
jgi:putative oxidoreductase